MKKNRKEKAAFKPSFVRPSFINSDGLVITTSVGVIVPKNKNGELMFEQALREFKRIVKESGVLEAYRAKQEYSKPSVVNRKKRQTAKRIEKLNIPLEFS